MSVKVCSIWSLLQYSMLPTFSFGSFGDIAAILQLAWAIRRALSETAGASAQILTLMGDIDSFTRSLQQIKSALEQRGSVPTELSNAVGHGLEECFVVLRNIEQRINVYKNKISNAMGVKVWRKYWTACTWEILGGRTQVETMKTRLFEQITLIQTLLAAAQAQNADRLVIEVQKHHQQFVHEEWQQLASFPGILHKRDRTVEEIARDLLLASTPFIFMDSQGAQRIPLLEISLKDFSTGIDVSGSMVFGFENTKNQYGTFMLEFFPSRDSDAFNDFTVTLLPSQSQHVLSDYNHLPWDPGSITRYAFGCFFYSRKSSFDCDTEVRWLNTSVYISEVFVQAPSVRTGIQWVVAPGVSSEMARIFRTCDDFIYHWPIALGWPIDNFGSNVKINTLDSDGSLLSGFYDYFTHDP